MDSFESTKSNKNKPKKYMEGVNLKKYIVNKRAIDNDELFQIINNSEGIYESTLIKLLQCNRISLEARLKTLENNKMISKQKIKNIFSTQILLTLKI